MDQDSLRCKNNQTDRQIDQRRSGDIIRRSGDQIDDDQESETQQMTNDRQTDQSKQIRTLYWLTDRHTWQHFVCTGDFICLHFFITSSLVQLNWIFTTTIIWTTTLDYWLTYFHTTCGSTSSNRQTWCMMYECTPVVWAASNLIVPVWTLSSEKRARITMSTLVEDMLRM